MTLRQIRLVQSTWPRMLATKDAAAQRFHGRSSTWILRSNPCSSATYTNQQGRKLMQVMDSAGNGSSRLEHIVTAVRELGMRHVGNGVMDSHHDTAGAARRWALDSSLGPEFTPDVNEAGEGAYGLLASTMRRTSDLCARVSNASRQP